jgi:hypothetical protein
MLPRSSRRQRTLHVLTGIGIAFTTFLLVLGVFLAAVTLIKLLRVFLDARFDKIVSTAQRANNEPDVPLSPIINNQSSIPPREELIFASWSDLFSSTAALDAKGTTMYRDDAATAFLFPPDVEWKEANDQSAIINNQLLVAKGTILTLNGAVVNLPDAPGEVSSVSAEVVGGRWVVGIVRKQAGKYDGYAYWYDGKAFSPIFPEGKAFTSDYPGVWGFGGVESDFLAVYGAYEGKGYRFRNSKATGLPNIVDVSWLFGVRMMKGGIEPGIVRVSSNQSSLPAETLAKGGIINNHPTWYLFNKARTSRPVFVKLFQNGTDEIVGEANLLGTAPQGFTYFALDAAGGGPAAGQYVRPHIDLFPLALRGYAESHGITSAWTVTDRGFTIPPAPVTITSANLNNYANAEVPHILKLAFREFSAGGASVALAASNGGEWEPVQSGADHWFKNPHGTDLRWKMTVTPGTNPDFTPFIGILDLDYEVKRH